MPDNGAYPTLSLVGGDEWQVIVGRRPGCALRLTHPKKKISKQHCGLWMSADGTAFVRNYGANGTFINGDRMPKGTKRRLNPGDEISFPAPPPGVTIPTLTFIKCQVAQAQAQC